MTHREMIRKRRRPWERTAHAWLIAGVIGLLVVVGLDAEPRCQHLANLFGGGFCGLALLGFLLGLRVFRLDASSCPSCRKDAGSFDSAQYCQHCGVDLDEDMEERD